MSYECLHCGKEEMESVLCVTCFTAMGGNPEFVCWHCGNTGDCDECLYGIYEDLESCIEYEQGRV